ncbi:MAG: YdcF family protein [Candidatus Paceibacterota bacterium]
MNSLSAILNVGQCSSYSSPPVEEKTQKEVNEERAFPITTDLCFGKQDSHNEPSEVILIFGTANQMCQRLCGDHFKEVVKSNRPKAVFITGGNTGANWGSESEQIMSRICPGGTWRSGKYGKYNGIKFVLEEDSRNTLQNVQMAISLGLAEYKSISFIAKGYHCGRCRLTLEKLLPGVKFYQHGYVASVSEKLGVIEPDLWTAQPELIRIVWREFLKIEAYGSRGDIAYPDDVRQKVAEVHRLLGNDWKPS